MGLSIDCAMFHSNQHAHSEVILKENKTDDVICLHFGVHVYICGHMIPSSECVYLGYTGNTYADLFNHSQTTRHTYNYTF